MFVLGCCSEGTDLMLYLYITDLGHFQTEREPNIQEISMMKAGDMKIYSFDRNFSDSEFRLITDLGSLTEGIEMVE